MKPKELIKLLEALPENANLLVDSGSSNQLNFVRSLETLELEDISYRIVWIEDSLDLNEPLVQICW